MTNVIVIDTNVFEHVLNPQNNIGKHINSLFKKIVQQAKKLGVDQAGGGGQSRIIGEYNHRFQPLRNLSDPGNFSEMLRYIFNTQNHVVCPMNLADSISHCVTRHLTHVRAEPSDRIFVYVACTLDCVMITNDAGHILSIRTDLQACAITQGKLNADFMSSIAAEAAM